MRWFKRIALTLVAIVVLLLGIGLILPSTFKVQRSIDVSAAPDKIYPLIADPREWKKWSAWNARDPAMKIAYSGRRWQRRQMDVGKRVGGQRGNDLYCSGAESACRLRTLLSRLRYAVCRRDEAGPPARARVTWTNHGDVGTNPINRYFAQAMDRLVGPDFETGLKNLKALAEHSSTQRQRRSVRPCSHTMPSRICTDGARPTDRDGTEASARAKAHWSVSGGARRWRKLHVQSGTSTMFTSILPTDCCGGTNGVARAPDRRALGADAETEGKGSGAVSRRGEWETPARVLRGQGRLDWRGCRNHRCPTCWRDRKSTPYCNRCFARGFDERSGSSSAPMPRSK